ncbi:MAG: mannose-1-phosphate guanylyltransferase [Flavobacteriaceae bacterium]|nr:mannose-1-phosphate guanylyltransferase [Flavobacteriaceae bacterium]
MSLNSKHFAVIMAGGVGSRFWPVSTQEFPKQFHDLMNTGSSLLQQTFARLQNFIPTENIFVLTNADYVSLVHEQIPGLNDYQIVPEPAMRNTAPCILLAALKIQKIEPDAVMLVAPSDHLIDDDGAFREDILKCMEHSRANDSICTLGITPDAPKTGFGYIEYQSSETEPLHAVIKFREKPDKDTAEQFLAQGNFLWNAGIFVWSIQTIVQAFKENQTAMFELFFSGLSDYNTTKETGFLEANYGLAENISVDYAILEKAESIYVLPATFGWSDLGTWGSLFEEKEKNKEGNVVIGATLSAQNSTGNMIFLPKGKLAVIEGVNDYIIVEKDNVILMIPREKEQEIMEIVARVKREHGDSLKH